MASTFKDGPINTALLISGSGTTAEYVIRRWQDGAFSRIRPVCLIASHDKAPGIDRWTELGMPGNRVYILDRRDFADQETFGVALGRTVADQDAALACQFGWTPYTPPVAFEVSGAIWINQHPGGTDPARATEKCQHPDFGGKGMHGKAPIAAYLHFMRLTGRALPLEATSHLVGTVLDAGAVLGCAGLAIDAIPKVIDKAVVETHQKRLLALEWQLQTAVLQQIDRTGELPSFTRAEPLIYPHEYPALAEAKRLAIEMYPNG